MTRKIKQKKKSTNNTPSYAAESVTKSRSLSQTTQDTPLRSPHIVRIRIIGLCILILVLALVFAVPRRSSELKTPEHPDEAIFDQSGLLSKEYAWTTAGLLLNEVRFQMIISIEATQPEGNLSAWTHNKAAAWHIGSKEDDGLVLFIFRDARIAKVEVGYDLEDRLPDVLVRRLLEDRLASHFVAGDYEGGIDAFIDGVKDALGGDDELQKLWLELGGKPKKSTIMMMLDTYSEGIERAPRTIEATWRNYIEGGPTERIVVLFFVAIFLAILAVTITVAILAIAIARKLLKDRSGTVVANAHSSKPGINFSPRSRLVAGISGLVFSIYIVAFLSLILMFALSLIGDQMHRKGDFSGAGAQVLWLTAN